MNALQHFIAGLLPHPKYINEKFQNVQNGFLQVHIQL